MQPCQGGFVERQASGLHDGAFIPVQSQPAQIVQCLFGGSRLDARRIEILDAQHYPAALRPGGEPGCQVRAGIADMLSAGRRRSQTPARGSPAHRPVCPLLKRNIAWASGPFSRNLTTSDFFSDPLMARTGRGGRKDNKAKIRQRTKNRHGKPPKVPLTYSSSVPDR